MGKIDYKKIYQKNKIDWKGLTDDPQRHEALLAGHYSDSNHFVYELLQNAEDEEASSVVFEYYPDRLVFYHDGTPFDENDVIGVSSMLMGTKDRNSAQKIGRFGMGFKSVFKYTYQPEIYSNEEAFRIESYLLPVELENKWNYQEEKQQLSFELTGDEKYTPFIKSDNLTKFVIPFIKYDKDEKLTQIPSKDVLEKLRTLDQEILLFLTHIKKLFWIDRTTGKYAMISLETRKKDTNMFTCRIEGSEYMSGEEVVNYLKYSETFDHPDMHGAQVSVAFRLNNRLNNINEMPGTNIWVYFPTKDATNLPFLIHGSFETAVSREKLMAPSEFNNNLFTHLEDLICNSLLDLRNRNLVTQAFLRRVLLPAFSIVQLSNLKEKVNVLFRSEAILPVGKEEYASVNESCIAVPYSISDFRDFATFEDSFQNVGKFVAFNNEREANFAEYFRWLREDVGVKLFTLHDWAKKLSKMVRKTVESGGIENKYLRNFYSFLSDFRESVFVTAGNYSRRGAYELAVRDCLSDAWELLREAPLVLNAKNKLMPAYQDGKNKIYLSSASEYKNLNPSYLVNAIIAKDFKTLLEDGFDIDPFDNFQFVKENIIKKYVMIDQDILFNDDENYENENVEDIKQVLAILSDSTKFEETRSLLKEAYIIQVIQEDGTKVFGKPEDTCLPTSKEGITLKKYFVETDLEYDYADIDFYRENGITELDLALLGVIDSPVVMGKQKGERIHGQSQNWFAEGDFYPQLKFLGLSDNLYYIAENADAELAKYKSNAILKLALIYYKNLKGKIRYRKTNPYIEEELCEAMLDMEDSAWLFDKNDMLHSPQEISKLDLNISYYDMDFAEKEAYVMIGFLQTEEDNKADTFDMVSALDKKSKNVLLRQLAKELGLEVNEVKQEENDWDEEEGTFSINDLTKGEFPVHSVRNMDNLVNHVREQFFCADPIKYEKVLRQIRVSKNPSVVRAYVTSMYTNDVGERICQMCKQPTDQVEVTEIANFGMEMEQLNLCLCRNCAGRYKLLRDKNKDFFRSEISEALNRLDVNMNISNYEIEITEYASIFLTQTHVAEIQAILKLIHENGLPRSESNIENALTLNESNNDVVDLKEDEIVIDFKETVDIGCLVTYTVLETSEQKDVLIKRSNPSPLQLELMGHKVGDIIVFKRNKIEINEIM